MSLGDERPQLLMDLGRVDRLMYATAANFGIVLRQDRPQIVLQQMSRDPRVVCTPTIELVWEVSSDEVEHALPGLTPRPEL